LDVTQALKDTENSLRDFIARVLLQKLGSDWVEKCGVAQERVVKWQERQDVERKRQETGVVEERLIYYADFYDLKAILKKHWQGEFSTALGDWKTMEVFLSELEKYRDPDAHRRELLPHQKDLISGIAGEIRTRLIRYRNKMETIDDCFPRIECVRDSLGSIWTAEQPVSALDTGIVLHPGDYVEFVATARDPEDLDLEYGIMTKVNSIQWQGSRYLSLKIDQEHISIDFNVYIAIKSARVYHAYAYYDHVITFRYKVLPSNKTL